MRGKNRAVLAAAWLGAAPPPSRRRALHSWTRSWSGLLIDELSGEIAYENMRITTQWHKLSGSADFFATARYVMEKAKAYGLEDVRWIDQKAENPYWEALRAEAWILEGDGATAREMKLGSYTGVETSIADYSRPADLTAELVDVGSGETAADYRSADVRGKIVLASGALGVVTEQAVWRRGAAGILSYNSSRLNPLADAPDQVAWLRVPLKDGPKGEKTTFAFVLSPREGQELSERLRGQTTRRIFAEGSAGARRLRVRVVVESRFLPNGKTAMVEGRIRGTDLSLPEVVLTAHLQESKPSANDDQSGVASILEIGRTLTRLIRENRIPRPRRGIRFWWADEIYSEYRYFADHPEEAKKVLVNLNQDMVGARQSIGGRVQYMARPPWSRPSFLPDVQESILDAVADGNHGFLAAWQAQSPPAGVGFSRPNLLAPRIPRAVPRARHSVPRQHGPSGFQRRVGRRPRDVPDELARRDDPLIRRRSVADRPHADQAQCVRRGRFRLVDRHGGRLGDPRPGLFRHGAGPGATRPGSRHRPRRGLRARKGSRRRIPRRRQPPLGLSREGKGRARLDAARGPAPGRAIAGGGRIAAGPDRGARPGRPGDAIDALCRVRRARRP